MHTMPAGLDRNGLTPYLLPWLVMAEPRRFRTLAPVLRGQLLHYDPLYGPALIPICGLACLYQIEQVQLSIMTNFQGATDSSVYHEGDRRPLF